MHFQLVYLNLSEGVLQAIWIQTDSNYFVREPAHVTLDILDEGLKQSNRPFVSCYSLGYRYSLSEALYQLCAYALELANHLQRSEK